MESVPIQKHMFLVEITKLLHASHALADMVLLGVKAIVPGVMKTVC
jgi:hypothetical protein